MVSFLKVWNLVCCLEVWNLTVLLRSVEPDVLFRNMEPGVLCVSACPDGLFGPNCRETCDCKTGLHCDPFRGCVGQ